MPLSTPLAQADDMKASTQPRPEAFSPTDSIRLPISAHRSQPWRIHQIAPDFKLLDVWALPTPGGPDFPRLVRQVAEGDTSKSLPPAARALFTIRWKLGKLLGWDAPGSEWALGCRHWGSGCPPTWLSYRPLRGSRTCRSTLSISPTTNGLQSWPTGLCTQCCTRAGCPVVPMATGARWPCWRSQTARSAMPT
jgi:hypothetical protein